jgi:hypothetical protein
MLKLTKRCWTIYFINGFAGSPWDNYVAAAEDEWSKSFGKRSSISRSTIAYYKKPRTPLFLPIKKSKGRKCRQILTSAGNVTTCWLSRIFMEIHQPNCWGIGRWRPVIVSEKDVDRLPWKRGRASNFRSWLDFAGLENARYLLVSSLYM